jgi:hypothetical protein
MTSICVFCGLEPKQSFCGLDVSPEVLRTLNLAPWPNEKAVMCVMCCKHVPKYSLRHYFPRVHRFEADHLAVWTKIVFTTKLDVTGYLRLKTSSDDFIMDLDIVRMLHTTTTNDQKITYSVDLCQLFGPKGLDFGRWAGHLSLSLGLLLQDHADVPYEVQGLKQSDTQSESTFMPFYWPDERRPQVASAIHLYKPAYILLPEWNGETFQMDICRDPQQPIQHSSVGPESSWVSTIGPNKISCIPVREIEEIAGCRHIKLFVHDLKAIGRVFYERSDCKLIIDSGGVDVRPYFYV